MNAMRRTHIHALLAVALAGCASGTAAPTPVSAPTPTARVAAPNGASATAAPRAQSANLQPASVELTATPTRSVAVEGPTAIRPTPSPEPVAERVPVIEYHYSTYAMGQLTQMRTEWFLAQLDWLAANGYRTLTGAEFTAHLSGEVPAPARSVVLRFDVAQSHFDDYAEVIVPALRERGQHGLFFILASRTVAECDGEHACWPTLKDWADEGVISPESHTQWHINYNDLTAEELWRDARLSKETIEAETGHTVHGLCYPFDAVSAKALTILPELGYAFAVGGYTRNERAVLFADPAPFALPSLYPYSSPEAYPELTSHPGQTFATLLEPYR